MSDQDTTTEEAPEATEETTTEVQPDAPEAEGEDEAWDPERAKRKIAKLNSEAAGLRKRVNEAPKADDIAAKDKRIGDLETATLRYEVAFDLGLPKEIASRLMGSTKEEMTADAEKLLELIAPAKRSTQRPTESLRGGLQPDKDPEETDLKKLGQRMFQR